MKKTLLLAITTIFGALMTLNAQQRKCEMDISLVSPGEGAIIAAYAQYDLTVRITNNGPDDLVLGDTVYYNIPTMPLMSFNSFVLPQGILAGTSANIKLATLMNNNQNTADETLNFYVKVVSNLDPSAGAFVDTLLTNNNDDNDITYRPCNPDGTGGTAIGNVTAKELNMEVFPNPATEYFTVRSQQEAIRSVKITDISGRVVSTQIVADLKETRISLSGMPSGLYFLRVETTAGIAVAKITKQ